MPTPTLFMWSVRPTMDMVVAVAAVVVVVVVVVVVGYKSTPFFYVARRR